MISAPAVIRTGFYTPMFGLDALTKHVLCFRDGLDEIKTAFLLFLSLVLQLWFPLLKLPLSRAPVPHQLPHADESR
jgi:hypothetical protein